MQSFPNDILSSIRQHLEEEKTQVVARRSKLSLQDPYADPDRVNDNAASDTEASEESDHDRNLALVEELNRRVQSIDEALVRIGNGSYGFCTNCGAMINTDRLSVIPTATLCLECEQTKSPHRRPAVEAERNKL